ncbi:protein DETOXIFICATION 44, chloroplastic-like [Primulina tabacum]|uniref:protein DETOXIFICATION 44, chloroplastic-like n=1 Tax=Primulina tabacum TaxID=48773 RepID=UPI003F5A83E7
MTTTLATSIAAHVGPIRMAVHQICFQVWLALSLLSDGLALVGLALLASDYSQGNYGLVRQLVYKVLQVGLIMGLALAVILFIGFGALSSLFSPDSEVFGIARSGTSTLDLLHLFSGPTDLFSFHIDDCSSVWSHWCLEWVVSIYDFPCIRWYFQAKL